MINLEKVLKRSHIDCHIWKTTIQKLSSILQSHAALHHGIPTSAASGQQQIIQNSTAELNNQRRPVSTQGSPIK